MMRSRCLNVLDKCILIGLTVPLLTNILRCRAHTRPSPPLFPGPQQTSTAWLSLVCSSSGQHWTIKENYIHFYSLVYICFSVHKHKRDFIYYVTNINWSEKAEAKVTLTKRTLPRRWPRRSCIKPPSSRLHLLVDGHGRAVSSQHHLDYTTLAMATAELYPATIIQTTLPWRWPRQSCIQPASYRLLLLDNGYGTAVSSQLHLDYTTQAMAMQNIIRLVQSRLHQFGNDQGTAVSSQLCLDYTTVAMATAQLDPASSVQTTLPC